MKIRQLSLSPFVPQGSLSQDPAYQFLEQAQVCSLEIYSL